MSFEHDDIAAVASIAGVELKYKKFSPQVVLPTPEPEVAVRPPGIPQPTVAAAPALAIPLPRARRSVFEDAAQRSSEAESKLGPWGEHLPRATIAFKSLSGGVGITTIQATLGRILADRGFSTLLVERSRDGLLPHYFGAIADGWGRSMFQPADPLRQAPVAVLSGGLGDGSIVEDDVWRMIDSHRGASDCVLLEQWEDPAESTQAIISTEAFQVVVLVPDPQTAIRIRRLTAAPRSLERTYFLLNKFDSSVPLHREMRAWLAGKLDDRLLGVTIRRSDAVSDAMAEGMTIAEFGPSSPVAHDFGQLADWFQQMSTKPGQ